MAVVHERMSRVEPKAVQPILANPVDGGVDDEAANQCRARAIEIDGAAPRRVMAIGDVFGQELRQVRAFGPEVVVDDIEDDAQPETVRRVDERSQIVGMAVVLRWRIQIDAVVSPVAASREGRDRHQLDRRRTERTHVSEALTRRRKRPGFGEGSDVKLVDYEIVDVEWPGVVTPLERVRIDDLRRAVHTFWLEPRGRVGPAHAVDQVAVGLPG